MAEAATSLPEAIFTQMQHESFVLLHTVDAENKGPTSSAISWIYAVNREKLRFVLDARSRLIANMRACPDVCITVFGGGNVHAVYGRAKLVTEKLEGVPFPLACVDVDIEAVRDAMFYGARLSIQPEYEKTYDKRAADRLDNQVFEAMRKAQ